MSANRNEEFKSQYEASPEELERREEEWEAVYMCRTCQRTLTPEKTWWWKGETYCHKCVEEL